MDYVSFKLYLDCALVFGSLLNCLTAQSICVSVKVSGSVHQSDKNGVYLRYGQKLCNSRHMWIHEAGTHYLYYVLDGYDGWVIGQWSCHWGNFAIASKSTAEEPYEVSEVWKEFSDIGSIWKNNSGLAVRCFDDVRYKTDCRTEACQNGASCVDEAAPAADDAFLCSCPHGFYGRMCETAIDASHCKSSPCSNGAVCIDLSNDFECKCQPGFSGRQCDIETDAVDCSLWPCHEKCRNNDEMGVCSPYNLRSLHTHEVAMIILVVGIVLVVIAAGAVCASKHLKQYYCHPDRSSCVENFIDRKDMNYRRLDSVSSHFKVSIT